MRTIVATKIEAYHITVIPGLYRYGTVTVPVTVRVRYLVPVVGSRTVVVCRFGIIRYYPVPVLVPVWCMICTTA